MFKALCFLGVMVSSAALSLKQEPQLDAAPNVGANGVPVPNVAFNAKDVNATRPKYANPEGVELLWQRPRGNVRGVLLYLHGCHGRATHAFSSDGPDGFHFDVCDLTKKKKCMGYIEEIMLRKKARKAGYVFVAVSGGVGSPRGCQNTNDVPRIQLAMKHLIEVEEPDLADKPVIAMGHSSGGRILPELVTTGASIKNAKCIVPIADEIRIKGDSAAPLGPTPGYPEDVSAIFVHMEQDEEREKNVKKNMGQMKGKGVRTGDLLIKRKPLTPEVFMADGYGMKKETAEKLWKALKEFELSPGRPYISGDNMMLKNPYGGGDNYRTCLEKPKNKAILEESGGFQVIQQYLDVAWSEHWMAAGRYLNEILAFCEQPGNQRKSQLNTANYDLVAKVRDINMKSNQWKKDFETKSKSLKANHGAQANLNDSGHKEQPLRAAIKAAAEKKKGHDKKHGAHLKEKK